MSSSVHVGNKGRDILIIGEGPAQGLDHTIFTAEAKYPINFTQSGKRFLLSLHFNGRTAFCLLMIQKYVNWNQGTPEKKIIQCV